MGRPRIQQHCRDCGRPCAQRGRYDQGYRCAECGVERHKQAAREINARRGEYYEKWVMSMAAAVERERARIAAYQQPADSVQVE